MATPAFAQLGTTVSVFTDLRSRGYTLSDGRPVAILDFAFDDAEGFYAEGAGVGVLRSGGRPAPLGLQLDAGYARRLSSGTTIDVGASHSTFSHYSTGEGSSSYTQVYAGVARGALSGRLFVSPDYLAGAWTAYGEVNGSFGLAPKWRLDGHVGTLVPLEPSSGDDYRSEFDWSLGVTRELGRVSLHAQWRDGTPSHDFYRGRRHGRGALVFGGSWAL